MASTRVKFDFATTLILLGPLYLTFIEPIIGSSSSGVWVDFGRQCDSAQKCDRRAHLACGSDGICACIRPETMVFEFEAPEFGNHEHVPGKCVVRIGEQCKMALNVLDEDGREMFIKYPCTRNSECDTAGFCSCDSGFYETLNGTCSVSHSYLQDCHEDNNGPKCNTNLGLECINGVCDCNSDDSVFDSKQGTCVGLVGKACFNGSCIEHAGCTKEGSTNNHDTQGICTCQAGYYERNESFCVSKGAIGESCEVDHECGSDYFTDTRLVCTEGRCECDPSISAQISVYVREQPEVEDEDGPVTVTKLMCAPKAGLPCFEGHCAPLSDCKLDARYDGWYSGGLTSTNGTPPSKTGGDTASGVCECFGGLKLYETDRTCRSLYGEACDSDRRCVPPFVCLDGLCECKYDIQSYSAENEFCRSKINGPCSSNAECPSLAHCELIYETSAGHCVCDSGYVSVPQTDPELSECKTMFGGNCAQSDECDSIPGLRCINSQCACRGFSAYSHEFRKCLTLVGGYCDSKDNMPCTENAVCQRPKPLLAERCICPGGYYETGNYTCILPPTSPGGVSGNKGIADKVVKDVGRKTDGLQVTNGLEPLPQPVAVAGGKYAGIAKGPLRNSFTD